MRTKRATNCANAPTAEQLYHRPSGRLRSVTDGATFLVDTGVTGQLDVLALDVT